MEPAVWRVLDANANRAREGLRVLEESARFILNDVRLAALAKDVRHELATALAPFVEFGAMRLRDTPGDVGTALAGSGEYHRADCVDVVRASARRLTESLRALEEYGKLFDVALAQAVERVRYRAYELERQILHVFDARSRFGAVRLYVLVTASLCSRPWQEVMRQAARGGADCFQLREPELDGRALYQRAEEFCALCRELKVPGIINDRADVAAAVGAAGVHVGQRDLPLAAARRVVGPRAIVGVSTHNLQESAAAIAECPDYLAAGPMFATQLKPEYGVAGLEYLRQVRAGTALPIVAIGGIDAANASDVVDAGATTVAVCSAIIAAEDPCAAAQAIRAAWSRRAPDQ